MLKTLAKFALLRVLPRRILPIVTVVEVLLFVRSIRKRSTVHINEPVRVNEPADSRTGPPPESPPSAQTPRTSRTDAPASDPV